MLIPLLAACQQLQQSPYGEDVLPTEDKLAINLKGADDAAKSPSDPDDWAMYYEATRNVTENVNGLIKVTLGIVYGVVHTQEPSWVDEGEQKAMWGPYQDSGLDPVSVGVYVERLDDESHDWSVFFLPNGGELETDAVSIIAGHVEAGASKDAADGQFAIDFTTAHDMDPSVNLVGTFSCDYGYDEAGVAAVVATDDYGLERGPQVDALYTYDEDYEGAGTMNLAYLADVNANGTEEVVAIKSRWTADGQGRGDGMIVGGDTTGEGFQSSECWGTDFKTAYWIDNKDFFDPIGDESVCAFTPAEFPTEDDFAIEESAEE